jgi:hypothetical protein
VDRARKSGDRFGCASRLRHRRHHGRYLPHKEADDMLLIHEESLPSTEPVAPEARAHETIHHFLVKRADAGIDGLVELGTLLEWIDFAAHSTAAQWCSVGRQHSSRSAHSRW